MPCKPSAKKDQIRHLRHAIEFLEPRRLLTTLHGGDTFEWPDPNSKTQLDRAVVTGNTTVELIGASVDALGNVTLGDLAGSSLNGGGGAAASGAQALSTITVAGNSNPVVNALASNAGGTTYGFIVQNGLNGGTLNPVQIVQISPVSGVGTVVGEISGQILAKAGGDFNFGQNLQTVTNVTAAAFSPLSGLLYFVAQANGISKLFTVNVNAGNAAAIASTVAAVPGTFGTATVGDIAFDQTSAVSERLFAVTTAAATGGTGGTGGTATGPQILQVDLANVGNPLSPTFDITIAGTAPTGTITGLAFNRDNIGALTRPSSQP